MSVCTTTFDWVRELVDRGAAIALAPGKEYLVESRLAPIARREGHESVDAFIEWLRARPNAQIQDLVVEAMTTNETSWFRDPYVYDAVSSSILPDLIERRGAQNALHVWSAACSTGQEPYSLGMLLLDNPKLARWNLNIIATDINRAVLARANEGRYSQLEVNRGLPARSLVRFFEKADDYWEVGEDLKRLVDFRRLCLQEKWSGLPRMDLVLLRNVLIYFDDATKKSILQRVRDVLRPDGYLVLGTAESPGSRSGWESVKMDGFRCYRPESGS